MHYSKSEMQVHVTQYKFPGVWDRVLGTKMTNNAIGKKKYYNSLAKISKSNSKKYDLFKGRLSDLDKLKG